METQDGGRTWQEAFLLPDFASTFNDIDVLTVSGGFTAWAVGDRGLVVRLASQNIVVAVPGSSLVLIAIPIPVNSPAQVAVAGVGFTSGSIEDTQIPLPLGSVVEVLVSLTAKAPTDGIIDVDIRKDIILGEVLAETGV